MRKWMWEEIAGAFVDDMVQREGDRKTIDSLFDCGCTSDEIIDDLIFDPADVEEVMTDRGESFDD